MVKTVCSEKILGTAREDFVSVYCYCVPVNEIDILFGFDRGSKRSFYDQPGHPGCVESRISEVNMETNEVNKIDLVDKKTNAINDLLVADAINEMIRFPAHSVLSRDGTVFPDGKGNLTVNNIQLDQYKFPDRPGKTDAVYVGESKWTGSPVVSENKGETREHFDLKQMTGRNWVVDHTSNQNADSYTFHARRGSNPELKGTCSADGSQCDYTLSRDGVVEGSARVIKSTIQRENGATFKTDISVVQAKNPSDHLEAQLVFNASDVFASYHLEPKK